MLRFLSQRIANKSENLYLMILDVNKFKSINDTYGHNEGDYALIRIAEALKIIADKYQCFVSRYGGDEFVIICESDLEKNIIVISQDLNKEIERINKEAGVTYSLKVSVGYAKYPNKAITIPDFIHMADQQLYLAKQNTRMEINNNSTGK